MKRLPGVMVVACVIALSSCSGDDDPINDSDGRPSASASESPAAQETPPETDVASVIDECLLGRWQQDSMTMEVDLEGDLVDGHGWEGRVLEFRPDGIEFVSYENATPIEAEGPDGTLFTETWEGTAVYRVATSGDALVFNTVDFAKTSVSWTYGDRSESRQLQNTAPPPVRYTCDDTTHTQRSETYEATFTRITP